MPAPSTALTVDPDVYQGRIRRLLIPVKPMPAETLRTYLHRLTEENHLFPSWLSTLAKKPGFLLKMAVLTGYSDHQLVACLPELRTAFHIQHWPHLDGQPSAWAGTRPACQHCVAVRLGTTAASATVFATHEQLICHRHQRWLGNNDLKCNGNQQFSLTSCPDIVAANHQHQGLITAWGRERTRAAFDDATYCMVKWSRWKEVLADTDIRRRWQLLDVTEETPPLRPAEIAALYPNAVALTELILTLRRRISASRRGMTAKIAAQSVELLSTTVVAGLTPSGAGDPFRQALTDVRLERQPEAESYSEITKLKNRA